MNLQKNILITYKNLFPNETLKETSSKTGIQQTRVFRIFNGSEMKLSEFEIFEEIISKCNGLSFRDLLETSTKCSKTLNSEKLKELYYQMNFLLRNATYLNL